MNATHIYVHKSGEAIQTRGGRNITYYIGRRNKHQLKKLHEHERDTYMYTNQGKPYKLEAGGTSTNETNSQLGGKTVSGEAHDDT